MDQVSTHQNFQYFGRDLEAMSFAKNYHDWIIDEFRPYLHRVVAEIGAGTGNFSELLSREPSIDTLLAFEPSVNMHPILADRFAHNTRVTSIQGYLQDEADHFRETLDAILYVNVLEHIENDLHELVLARATLKVGGHLLIFVPALQWLYSQLDAQLDHHRRYHKRELIDLVQSAGFKIIEVKYFDILGILPWYVAFVLFKGGLSAGNVSAYDRYVVPLVRRIERRIQPPIGKNLLLIAQKAY
jgi:SAM-dependent methyltransferase